MAESDEMRTPWPRWIPRKLGPLHDIAAQMHALGGRRRDIAEKLHVRATTVSHWRRSPEFQRAVQGYRQEIRAAMIQAALGSVRGPRDG